MPDESTVPNNCDGSKENAPPLQPPIPQRTRPNTIEMLRERPDESCDWEVSREPLTPAELAASRIRAQERAVKYFKILEAQMQQEAEWKAQQKAKREAEHQAELVAQAKRSVPSQPVQLSPAKLFAQEMLNLETTNDQERLDLICHFAKQKRLDHCVDEILRFVHADCPFNPFPTYEEIHRSKEKAYQFEQAINAGSALKMRKPSKLHLSGNASPELVPNLIPAAQIGTLSGSKNMLKTKIGLDLCISLATGREFLEYWPVPHCVRSVFVAGEDSEISMQSDIQRICEAKGIDYEIIDDRMFVTCTVPRPRDKQWRLQLIQFVKGCLVELLVIDGSYLGLAGADQRSLQAMGDALRPIKQIVDETGCTVLLTQHHKRAGTSRWPVLHDIAGVGFEEVARFWLLLNRNGDWDPGTGQHRLRLVVGNKRAEERYQLSVREGHVNDPAGRVWDVKVTPADDQGYPFDDLNGSTVQPNKRARNDDQLRKDMEAARQLLAQHPEGLSKTAIGAECKISKRRLSHVIQALLNSGATEETTISVGNQTSASRTGYRLIQTTSFDQQ